jgi:hypothetical protein
LIIKVFWTEFAGKKKPEAERCGRLQVEII